MVTEVLGTVMPHRTICAAIIAVTLVAGSQLAVHYALDPVARVAMLESRLFQPELRPSIRLNSAILAQAANGSIR
jgi:hypothetical protein